MEGPDHHEAVHTTFTVSLGIGIFDFLPLSPYVFFLRIEHALLLWVFFPSTTRFWLHQPSRGSEKDPLARISYPSAVPGLQLHDHYCDHPVARFCRNPSTDLGLDDGVSPTQIPSNRALFRFVHLS